MIGKRVVARIAIIVIVVLLAGAGLLYASQFGNSTRFSAPFIQAEPEPETLSLLFVGDIMLDRNVRNKINEIGFDEFFKNIKDFLSDADYTIGNLEGPFTTYPSKTADLKSKELVFTFDPAMAPKLGEVGFDIFGLANNHTWNFGREGLAMTKKYLGEANLFYYGDPNNKDGLSIIFERSGIKVGIVGFHEFHYVNFDKVIAEIERIRPQVDFLIVTPHWGPEYETAPNEFMQKWAHLFLDYGVDTVIGTHTHVIGDIEEYRGKKIFYSLGNFVFDQYFSKETSEGLAVKIVLEKEGGRIKPTYTLTRVEIGRLGVTVSE